MQNFDLILTLAGGFAAALAFGYITHRMGLSPIVGYLLAGIIVSPQTPGFVANIDIANQLAEIGVILIMFGIGLQFHFREFKAVWRIALPGALIQSLVTATLGAVVMHALGWDWRAGIVFGLAISVASTVVLTRVLSDNNDLHTQTGRIAIGWLVMEDLFTVFILVLLPVVFGTEVIGATGFAWVCAITAIKILMLIVITFTVGKWLLPRILANIADTGSRELFSLAVLAIALTIAVASAFMFQVSMALGAFLAGMVVGRSEFSSRAATEAIPLRDALAVIFFVSVGMLFNWSNLVQDPVLVLATLAIILIGKPVAAFLIVVLMRYPLRTALSVALVLSQIGEFSFILATLGTDLKILPENAQNILIAAAIISITLNPLLYRAWGKVERWLNRCTPRLTGCIQAWCRPFPDINGEVVVQPGQYHIVLIGYGNVGMTVVKLLQENRMLPTIIDQDIQKIESLRSQRIRSIYGDATHLETLSEAGVTKAEVLVISASIGMGENEIIRMARELNPRIKIIARTSSVSHRESLTDAGADVIFSDESAVALSITERILKQFGATPDQIDRERKRVQESQYAAPRPVKKE